MQKVYAEKFLLKTNMVVQLKQNGHEEGNEGEGIIDDPELLMSIMEAREQVEENEDPAQLQKMQQDNKQQQEACIEVMHTYMLLLIDVYQCSTLS